MLTITLAGPEQHEQAVRDALAEGAFTPLAYYHHGLGAERNTAFVTVTGDDMDAAEQAARPFGWTVRMHQNTDTSSIEVFPLEAA